MFMLRTGGQWKALPKSGSAVPAQCTSDFLSGKVPAYSKSCGKPDSLSTTRWRESPSDGRASTAPYSRRHWRKSPLVPTRRTEKKRGATDVGYTGLRALEIIESHGNSPHVVGRRREANAKKRAGQSHSISTSPTSA